MVTVPNYGLLLAELLGTGLMLVGSLFVLVGFWLVFTKRVNPNNVLYYRLTMIGSLALVAAGYFNDHYLGMAVTVAVSWGVFLLAQKFFPRKKAVAE